jgi:2'-hydroxyisoflavone reductase
MLETCRSAAGSTATLCWIDESYLLARNVAPWSELPLWIPEADNGIFEVRNDRAIAAGLRFRPLAETALRTLEWDRARERDVPAQNSLSAGREEELLRDAPHPAH